jgi:long-chain acyl-CoA synthetase
MKIAPDGEILVRGENVTTGYFNAAEETARAFEGGWFHTGDIGEIDADGFVKITDRKKDLFKTSGGKYVAPSLIEGQFKALCPYASQMVVHGNERNFCTAIITLDPDQIREWADNNGLQGKTYEQIVASPQVHDMVEGYIDELNTKLNRWETIKKFILLEHDLSVESGEVTPSLKVKRKVVESNYKDRLDALYR